MKIIGTMSLIVFYLLILLLVSSLILIRRDATLLRGNLFVRFNAVFFIALVMWLLFSHVSPLRFEFVFFIIILVISFLLRNKWILFKYDTNPGIIEESANAILLPFQKTSDGYNLMLSTGVVSIRIHEFFWRDVMVSFVGDWSQKKVVVLKNLLAKKIQGVLPKLTITLQ